MHSVIPILFVVSVEAARYAVGRIADITADKHMEGVRLTRWLLSPAPAFLLWRRMKLWELRSYDQVIKPRDPYARVPRTHTPIGAPGVLFAGRPPRRNAASDYSPRSARTRSCPTASSSVGRRGPVSRPTSRW
jgi:hypothetical protein